MNCIIVDDDKLSRRIVEEFVHKTDNLDLLGSFTNGIEAINFIRHHQDEVHVIFLDIEMPEMDGIELLKSLENPPQVIIISSKEKYALNAFEYDVTDYLLKPIPYSRFYKAVSKAFTRFERDRLDGLSKEEIFIKKNSTLVRLRYEDILWIEALENYVIFNTYTDRYTIHFTMKAIEQKLPPQKFTRVHRSYIVNVSSINFIEDNAIIVKTEDGHKSIPIGKSYKDKLMGDINLMIK
jgi:DNA-binding LytR/AlgR family response regulator